MAISAVIRDVLASDAGLAALLTGGIYSYEQIGRNGISRVTTPDAYAADGFLKPCAIVKGGDARATGAIRDDAPGMRQMVEVYLYDDGDRGYGTITQARDLAAALLDWQWLADAGFARRAGGADDLRDPKLNNAALVRGDFEIAR